MKTLVPIGRFSAICRLSQKALRLYDEMGLLRPAWVDPDSGYRYYALAQALEAEQIRLLRSLEVPLEEIAELLHDPTAASASSSGNVAGSSRASTRSRGFSPPSPNSKRRTP